MDQYARFTKQDHSEGEFLRANGQLVYGPLPPNAGDIRSEFDTWVGSGGVVEPYVEPPTPVPASLSRRQFFQIVAIKGWITWQEAEDAMGGAIPQALLGLIDELPLDDAQKFDARMLIKGATEFQRRHHLTYLLGYLFDLDDPAIDDLYRDGAAV